MHINFQDVSSNFQLGYVRCPDKEDVDNLYSLSHIHVSHVQAVAAFACTHTFFLARGIGAVPSLETSSSELTTLEIPLLSA